VGFFYIPGTDMCLKVGGWARFETGWGYNGSFTNLWWNNDLNNRSTANNNWRVKGVATFDARSQTEYGTVRSYIALGVSTNQVGNGTGALGAVAGSDDVANYANRWFIQWAGFTVGRSTSFFDFYSIGANQYGFAGASSDTSDGGWMVAGYTMNFGNGLSASISAEEQRRTEIAYAGTGLGAFPSNGFFSTAGLPANGAVGTNYEGHDYPDVVANLRVEQTWGSAQIMGALHNVATTYYGVPGAAANSFVTGTEVNGHPDDKMGFAVGAGIRINVPMIGPGDYFQAEVDYTQGASRYANHTSGVFDYRMYDGNSFGFGINSDAVFGGSPVGGAPSALELTTAWAVNAAYTHNWNAAWKSTLWGSYLAFNYNSNANAMLCSAIGDGAGAGTAAVANPGCNMDWSVWGVGLRTQWAVSSTFQIGLEVLYANLNSADTSTGLIKLGANSTKPAGTFRVDDQNNWAVRLRVNRDFYP
jgi:hypothetical protein